MCTLGSGVHKGTSERGLTVQSVGFLPNLQLLVFGLLLPSLVPNVHELGNYQITLLTSKSVVIIGSSGSKRRGRGSEILLFMSTFNQYLCFPTNASYLP